MEPIAGLTTKHSFFGWRFLINGLFCFRFGSSEHQKGELKKECLLVRHAVVESSTDASGSWDYIRQKSFYVRQPCWWSKYSSHLAAFISKSYCFDYYNFYDYDEQNATEEILQVIDLSEGLDGNSPLRAELFDIPYPDAVLDGEITLEDLLSETGFDLRYTHDERFQKLRQFRRLVFTFISTCLLYKNVIFSLLFIWLVIGWDLLIWCSTDVGAFRAANWFRDTDNRLMRSTPLVEIIRYVTQPDYRVNQQL